MTLAAGVAAALTACGGASEPEGEPETSPPAAPAPNGAGERETPSPAQEGSTGTDTASPSSSAGADEASETASSSKERGATASVAGLRWRPPSEWVVVPTVPGGMRAAQYTAPAPEGSALAAAEVIVFYFGPGDQGGDLPSNLQRWGTQVLDENGQPTQPSVVAFENGPLTITTALYEGTYQSGMPGGTRTPLRGWALLAAVVEGGPQGRLFIRMTGPAPVVDARREAFEVMIRTIEPIAAGEADEPSK